MATAPKLRSTIAALEWERRRIPLVVPFAITGSRQEEADCVFIKAVDADGVAGWGEASPLPIVTGDTVEGVLEFLSDVGTSFGGLDAPAALRLVQEELRPRFGALQTSALCGLETAFYDLLARQAGLPLGLLFHVGGVESVRTDITVPALATAELDPFWRHFASHGFDVFKVKVTGKDPADDRERALEAWRRLPPGGSLILDGNQGFTAASAGTLVEHVSAAGGKVAFFEQPLPRDDVQGLAKMVERGIPVCLDESVRSVPELLFLLRTLPAPRGEAREKLLVNLKIMKSGVHESLAIGLLARKAGLGLMMGGMMETDLAMTCSLHLCGALGGVEACDLDTPFYLRAQACSGSPYEPGRAELAIPRGVGLGIEPKPIVRASAEAGANVEAEAGADPSCSLRPSPGSLA